MRISDNVICSFAQESFSQRLLSFIVAFVATRDFACITLFRLPAMKCCRRSCRMSPATCIRSRNYSFDVEGSKIFTLRLLIILVAICQCLYTHHVLLSCTSCSLNERVYSTFCTDTASAWITPPESHWNTSLRTASSYLRKSHAKRNLRWFIAIY